MTKVIRLWAERPDGLKPKVVERATVDTVKAGKLFDVTGAKTRKQAENLLTRYLRAEKLGGLAALTETVESPTELAGLIEACRAVKEVKAEEAGE